MIYKIQDIFFMANQVLILFRNLLKGQFIQNEKYIFSPLPCSVIYPSR